LSTKHRALRPASEERAIAEIVRTPRRLFLPPRRLRDLRRSLVGIARETEAGRVNAPFFDLDS